MELSQMYDEIKSKINQPPVTSNLMDVGNQRGLSHPGALQWRAQANKEADRLREGCSKKILLDIYCKIVPLDDDFIQGNQGMMKQDIDDFLDNKGMTGQQYLKSCGEKTNAPMVEFVIRSINNIGKAFMEKADETLKDAQENDIDIPAPEADVDSEETEGQLVEIEKDEEYESFIDKLKKKTINRIVSEISDLIKGKETEKDIEFNPQPKTESTIGIVLDYFHTKLWNESVDLTPKQNDEIMGIAIRESTLNAIDRIFKQPDSDIRPFTTKIRFGKGVIMNESVITTITESAE